MLMKRKMMDDNMLDAITVVSFLVGLQNLDLNVTQEDMQNTTNTLDEKLREQVKDIHEHLAVQDAKLNTILDMLHEREVSESDS